MSGKFWILITAVLVVTNVYDVRSRCIPHDLKLHLDDMLLEEHMFEIKVFTPETQEHKLLSVFNTLCSYWTNNKKKKDYKINLKVVHTFNLMLRYLDNRFEDLCGELNCTDVDAVRRIDTATFKEMYRKSCNGSVSDLKCPSKNTSETTMGPTAEFSTTFLTTDILFTTDHKKESTTSPTTLVSPNITAPENLTTVSSPHTETMRLKTENQNLWATVNTCYGLLVLLFVLNIVLLFMVFHLRRSSKDMSQTGPRTELPEPGNRSREEMPLQDINNSST
ncbi:uncharacterized protein [Garra rufa]|uniref:uncharacterized protein isoform X1 n=1 Tax=Garra rufa TaxID=137080 RepID=UPI003CCEF6A6